MVREKREKRVWKKEKKAKGYKEYYKGTQQKAIGFIILEGCP